MNSTAHAIRQEVNIFNDETTSKLKNSEKRKVKRSFPRPKVSHIIGLDQDGLISMNNTASDNMGAGQK